MDYPEAIDFINSLTDYEKTPAEAYSASNFDLRRVEMLLKELGDPHLGRLTVHVAGTKGKGSTAAMIASVLKAAGVKTGFFSSPHLYSWQERITINGKPVSKDDFASIVGTVKPLVLKINGEKRFGKLTTFEVLTAIAFKYFKVKKAGAQVLETGMGGRLDATNVAVPDVCVITSISLDHTRVLGHNLEQIATEKAGIIKPECTVICAPQQARAQKVIDSRCREMHARLVLAGRELTWQPGRGDVKGQHFSVGGRLAEYKLWMPLLGDFQLENATLAIGVVETLTERGVKITPRDIARGLATVRWPLRMHVLQTAPLLIADGAHNTYSIRTVIDSIRRHYKFNRAYVIFGASVDKDIQGMAGALSGFAGRVTLAQSGHPRAAGIKQLEQAFKAAGVKTESGKDMAGCISDALGVASDKDLILVTGSLFLAAEAWEAHRKLRKAVVPPPVTDSGCARALR